MPHVLGAVLIAGVLTLGLASLAGVWFDEAEKSDLISSVDESREHGIEKVEVEFAKKQIFLNVHLSKPLTCNQVIKLLGIESLPVKEKIYVPTCVKAESNFIRITYSESISV